ncbi:MAG: 4-hydroxy-3-methylbut-2-enyl diphosphate reductase [Erysipelothrix sp.]|nr:4-hydroxy-3-methylbut-2-enyl diphosphate reductase [Erysipelothrix sp.]
MEVIPIAPRGFCKGVYQAIRLAKQTALDHPGVKITVLGQIVHNRYVVEALNKYGIQTLDDPKASRRQLLEKVDGGIVIFTAHGISKAVKEEAAKRNLTIKDATCEDVLSTQSLIESARLANQTIFYIGKSGHPEANAILESYQNVYLIEKTQDIPTFSGQPEIFVTNQTTLSKNDIEHIIDAVIKQYPSAVIAREICSATRLRQEAIEKIKAVDSLIVVGDPRSNNTRMLAKIAEEHGINDVMLIESIEQLDTSKLHKNMRIAVTAGASTPHKLTQQIIEYLKNYDFDRPADLPKVDIDTLLDE